MIVLTPDNLKTLSGAERRAAMALARQGQVRLDRSQDSFRQLPDWSPQPKQAEFLDCAADECLFGGAAGGGKTDGLLNWAIQLCIAYPGIEGTIVRRQRVDMTQPGALFSRSKALLFPLGWKWHSTLSQWTSPRGSVIKFAHVENDTSVERDFQGSQLEFLGIEEAGQFGAFQVNYLIGRVRTNRVRAAMGYRPQVRLTANPGGPGHIYLLNRYVRPGKLHGAGVVWQPEREPGQTVDPPTRCFIPATVDDNPALIDADPGYLAKLENLPEPYRSAYRRGDWDAFGGSFFSDWNEGIHLVPEHLIPDRWNRLCALDWGYNHPTVVLWGAVSPDGVVFIYRELWLRKKGLEELAERILSYPDTPDIIAAGPDVFTMNKMAVGGPTIAEELKTHGVFLENVCRTLKRHHQWQQVRKYLQWTDDDGPIAGRPFLRVMAGTAPKLCEQLPAMVADPDDPEDMLKVNIDPMSGEGGDDAVDALAYLCMSRPIASDEDDPLSLPRDSMLRRQAEREERDRQQRRGSLVR